jgi:hypothetical protein
VDEAPAIVDGIGASYFHRGVEAGLHGGAGYFDVERPPQPRRRGGEEAGAKRSPG